MLTVVEVTTGQLLSSRKHYCTRIFVYIESVRQFYEFEVTCILFSHTAVSQHSIHTHRLSSCRDILREREELTRFSSVVSPATNYLLEPVRATIYCPTCLQIHRCLTNTHVLISIVIVPKPIYTNEP